MSVRQYKGHFLAGAAIIALASPPAFAANETNQYALSMNTQTFDGDREYSLSQLAAISRVRVDNRSYTELDFGDAAVVIDDEQGLSVGELDNNHEREVSFEYNYDTDTLGGYNDVAVYHNTFVQPQLRKGPKVGVDAQWSVALSTHELGFVDLADRPITLQLERDYFTHDGKAYVAISYEIPAFRYSGTHGQEVIQWGKGLVLTDPTFGEVYWTGTQHSASARQATGGMRPYKYAQTLRSYDLEGNPRVDINAIPQISALANEISGASATQPIPFTFSPAQPDQTPFAIAGYLDIMAQSIGEDSANQSGAATAQAGQSGNRISPELEADIDRAAKELKEIRTALKYRKVVVNADKLNAASKYLENVMANVNAVNAEATATQNTITRLSSRMTQGVAELDTLNKRYFQIINNADNLDDIATNNSLNVISGRMQSINRTLDNLSKTLAAEQSTLRGLVQYNSKLQNLVQTAGQMRGKVLELNAKLDKFLKTPIIKSGLTAASFLSNVGKAVATGNRVGSFDASQNGNPELSIDYSSYSSIASATGWALFGAATDYASAAKDGTVVATAKMAFGVMTFASSIAADYFIINEGIKYNKLVEEEARMQYLLLLKKQTKQNEEAYQRLLNTPYGYANLYVSAPDPYANGYNLKDDIRVDPDTGLPTPGYWAHLKKSPEGRAKLARDFGIDPDAPVGTPPGTNWRKDNPNGGSAGDPPTLGDGDDYPTYDPDKDPNKQSDDQDIADNDQQEDPDADTDQTPFTRPQDQQLVLDEDFWAILDDLIENSKTLEESDDPALPASPWYSPPGSTSPLVLSDLIVSQFNIDPVTFDPVTWDPVTWKPPTWVPPNFVGPNGSTLDMRAFGGDTSWPSGSDWLAFDYFGLGKDIDPDNPYAQGGKLSGTVAIDLEPWREWLETQDERKLTRLALQAGYPNLASALADARNLIKNADNDGFRKWANTQPACGGYIGCGPPGALQGLWTQKRSQLALGDILADSRDLFSTAGLSDIGISGFVLSYVLSDFGLEDGDIIDVNVSQFSRTVFNERINLTNIGQRLDIGLRPGVATVNITAVNEGAVSPNTAAINLFNVSSGDDSQSYSLLTGERAVLKVSVGASAEPGS